ncbi:MAG: TrmH family RNA methyltransferase [Aggregatilineales bacterium]
MSPRIQKLYSENNAFQYVETLRRNREKRHRHREFFVEGVRPINQALAHGWPISAFYYTDNHSLSDWAKRILAESTAETHYELPSALLAKLSLKNEPSELLAVFSMPDDQLERIPIRENPLIVLFDRPASPGNLGSIIRSCDALGADGLVITGHSADLYDPETISATTGSLFALPVVRQAGLNDVRPWLETIRQRIGSLQLVGSSEDAPEDVATHDFTGPTVIALGNETWGLSAAYQAACNRLVRIPMGGSASSLNVACAASILLYEIDRQRRAAHLIP